MRVLLLVCAVVVLWPSQAHACTCSPPDAEQARARARFIAEGEVTDDVLRDHSALRRVTFKDVRIHRGPQQSEPLSIDNGNDCPPFAFESGHRYLIYMRALPTEQGAALTVCDRIVDSAGAEAELASLGADAVSPGAAEPAASSPLPRAGTAPVEQPPPAPRGTGGCGCWMAPPSAGGHWGWWLLGLIALRYRRRAASSAHAR